MEITTQIALASCENNGTDMCSDRKLSELEYANDGKLLSEDPGKLHVLIDCLNDSVVTAWNEPYHLNVQNFVAGLYSSES